MRMFGKLENESASFGQLTIVSYLGQRESLVPDLFQLLGTKKYACVYDPFSGSASVSFAAMRRGLAKSFIINESLPIFECLWKVVKNHPDELISKYSSLVKQYFAESDKTKRLQLYKKLLAEYNLKHQLGMMADAAILFVFLMNYSENHTPYFDEKMYMSARPKIVIDTSLEPKVLEIFEQRVRYLSGLFHDNQTNFFSGSFEDCLKTVSSSDLVIMDPPYPQHAKNVFFTPDVKEILQGKIRAEMERLSELKVDFMIFYGSRTVKLQDQFDEDKYHLHHLVRLSMHPDFGVFLDHIYVSQTLALKPESLPPGMAFYHSYFKKNEEMTQSQYHEAIVHLSRQMQEKIPRQQLVAKL